MAKPLWPIPDFNACDNFLPSGNIRSARAEIPVSIYNQSFVRNIYISKSSLIVYWLGLQLNRVFYMMVSEDRKEDGRKRGRRFNLDILLKSRWISMEFGCFLKGFESQEA